MLIENSVMILLWWQRRTVGKWYNTPALCSVWGGFALGKTPNDLFTPTLSSLFGSCLQVFRQAGLITTSSLLGPNGNQSVMLKLVDITILAKLIGQVSDDFANVL